MFNSTFDERLTTIQIYYYIPDYQSLLQEFTWQLIDYQPEFPQAHKFLKYWKENIDARINTIYLAHCDYWGNINIINFTKEIES
jgi:uncharacterized protein Usg